MMLAHAVLLAEARTYLAALADGAGSLDASLECERVLLQVDWLHGGLVPTTTRVQTHEQELLFNIASQAISNLSAHGVDALGLELCIAMLDAARAMDTPA